MYTEEETPERLEMWNSRVDYPARSCSIHKRDTCITMHYDKGFLLSLRKKTILRTIRITEDLDRLLRKDAETKDTNVNTLLNNMIRQYAEWDRYTETFGNVQLPSGFLRFLIETADEEKLYKQWPPLSSEILKAALLSWFGRVNEKNFFEFLSRTGKYSGLYSLENEANGRNYNLTFRHSLGTRWSTLLRELMSENVRNLLGVVPHAEASENSVVVSFTLPKT